MNQIPTQNDSVFTTGGRSFTYGEIHAFLLGSNNPAFKPLTGKESDIALWLLGKLFKGTP